MEKIWIVIQEKTKKDLEKALILATNTSGISISAIASVTKSPDRVVGMHWWNPSRILYGAFLFGICHSLTFGKKQCSSLR